MDFDLDTTVGRIAFLAEMRNARRYLEIGVERGRTFLNVDLPFKVAVDPAFLFDPADFARPGTHFFSLPSNLFFRNLRAGEPDIRELLPTGESEEKPAFDLIFIDGLHTFEQSYKDFINSLEFAHDDTIWVLDDTVPGDKFSAIRDMTSSYKARGEAGLSGKPWHGDVYKTVFAIHDNLPEFSYCTLMGGNPQTIVWKAEKSGRAPVCPSMDVISRLSFDDMLVLHRTLMPIEDEDLQRLVGQSLDPAKLVDPTANSLIRRLQMGAIRW